MGVYKDWQADLLNAGSLPDTAANRRFLTEWHNNATTDCHLNPIDLWHKETGSTNCAPLPTFSHHAQAYTDRVWTRTAFDAQINGGNFHALKAALETGNPYTVTDWQAVAGDIGNWGSGKFANAYLSDVEAGSQGGPGKGPGNDAQTLGGWKDLQHSLNHSLPRALRSSQQHRAQALRSLARASKVSL